MHFKLPICYNPKTQRLKREIADDLELTRTVDPSGTPVWNTCFLTQTPITSALQTQIAENYTTDVAFLKDNQTLLKTYAPLGVKYTDYSPQYASILEMWQDLKCEVGFKERYYYVEWEMLDFLNRSQWFLQFISIYNLISPILSLLVPVIILIIPFIIIKIKGLDVTIKEYIEILKTVATHNAIGKLMVSDFGSMGLQEKLYAFISAGFYLFSVYQNFMVCWRFHHNMSIIHNYFGELRIYLEHTIQSMRHYLETAKNLSTHDIFNSVLREKLEHLIQLERQIKGISDYNTFNIGKVKEIGYVLKCFYELHSCDKYHETLMYSLGFHGYLDMLDGLQENVRNGRLHFATFTKKRRHNVFRGSVYAPLYLNGSGDASAPVKNDVKLSKNIIITGPNASGKTTILKSTLINLIMTQNFGCGFYDSAVWKPFKWVHCYLNIPDTSGRDSLFQAEARRCKEILDEIHLHSKVSGEDEDTHFCAFDELYSGTNPEEAEQSATAFMKYLTNYKNVSCILTTHFVKVCVQLEKTHSATNYHMIAEKHEDRMAYKYKMDKGISRVKGGVLVLKQMDYPREIIEDSVGHDNLEK